jgi:hypothetical protein
MKTRFSMGKALEAPFVLLKTQPLALFGWGLIRMLLSAVFVSLMVPFFAALPFGEAAAAGSPEEMQAVMMQKIMPMEGGIQGMNLISLLVGVVIWAAAIRASAAPRGAKDRFLFLRLGMDELYVGVIMLISAIGFYIAAFVLALLGALVVFLVWQANEFAAVLVGFAYGFAAFAGIFWLAGRVMLIMPTSMALHTFAFEEGWKLGKGQGWNLAFTGLLSWLILMVIYVLVAVAVVGIFVGAAVVLHAPMPRPDTIHSFNDLIAMARPFLIPAIIVALPLALFDGFCHAMFGAPLASACKQLMESGKAPVRVTVGDTGGDNGGDGDPTPAL